MDFQTDESKLIPQHATVMAEDMENKMKKAMRGKES
jgi:hypothetical protein